MSYIIDFTPDNITTVKAREIALQYGITSATCESVYRAVRGFKNNTTHQAKVGLGTIAKAANCCRNTARKWLGHMEEIGVIAKQLNPIKKSDGEPWHEPNTYIFVAEKYGEAVKMKVDPSVKSISDYQAKKNDILAAKSDIAKKMGESVAKFSYSVAYKAHKEGRIVSGDPVKYMYGIAKKRFADMQEANKSFAEAEKVIKSTSDNTPDNEIKKPKKDFKAFKGTKTKKTSFHNFEQRSSNYSAKQIEEMARKKSHASKESSADSILNRLSKL